MEQFFLNTLFWSLIALLGMIFFREHKKDPDRCPMSILRYAYHLLLEDGVEPTGKDILRWLSYLVVFGFAGFIAMRVFKHDEVMSFQISIGLVALVAVIRYLFVVVRR